jgi:hypothetical protein
MKPQQMKNAFASISEEAGKDTNLSQAITQRVGAEKSIVPVASLKALFRQFLVIILTALLINFAISLIQVEAAADLPELDVLIEQTPVVMLYNQNAANSGILVVLCFFRGLVRGFILLAVLTFILTAAAMPVSRSDENTGGSPCVA